MSLVARLGGDQVLSFPMIETVEHWLVTICDALALGLHPHGSVRYRLHRLKHDAGVPDRLAKLYGGNQD
jgi:hypothetical protein